MHPQASFRFLVSERYQLEQFSVGTNVELLTRLRALPMQSRFAGTWLYAPGGYGKSHLLQASCQRATEQRRRAVYLPLARIADPQALLGLEDLDLVALDDVDLRLGEQNFEQALMALYTGLFAAERQLLIATQTPPAALAPLLPDLASRLRAFETFAVQGLDDAGKADVLRTRAALRGLPLSDEVLSYWLRRGSRELKRLLEDLELLIDHALGEQAPITVTTVKQALQL